MDDQHEWQRSFQIENDPAFLLDCRRDIDQITDGVMSMVFGRCLGKSGRVVYEIPMRPEWVVKVAVSKARRAANRDEWEFWDAIKSTEHAKWVAPCHYISACDSFLVMEKAQPITDEMAAELMVPSVFIDTRRVNWGTIDGRPVAIDYEWTHQSPGSSKFIQMMEERLALQSIKAE